MVQLSLSLSMTPPPDPSDTDDLLEDHLTSSKRSSPAGLEVTEETYPGYESYIEDGLICLKHKVRNLEKKKLKLEEYKKRLKRGEALNKDQMAAVEKYNEVVHNLTFAQELHRTLDGLTQNLLRSQRRAVKREQTARTETERRRLVSVLQLQQVLHSLGQDRVQADLLSGLNQAPRVQVQQLQNLTQLRELLGLKRDHTLSLKEQMENAAVLYVDLLDGKDKPVAGSTFKELKEELNVLVNSSYFSSLPPEPKEGTSEGSTYSTNDPLSKSEPPESSDTQWLKSLYLPDPVPGKTWDMDFKDLKDREPPDDWDAAYTESTPTERPTVGKPWRGGAALIPKNQDCVKKQSEGKRKKAKKARREEHFKPSLDLEIPVEVFNCPSALPKDPVLRKQQLEDLMTKIHGAFSFMQDSVLDGDSPPSSGHHRPRRRVSGSPSPLSRSDLKSPGDPLPKTLHSTPLPMRCLDNKPSLTNGDHSLDTSDTSDLELSKDHSHEALHVSDRKAFPSPPLYCREPSVSVSIEDRRTPQSPVSVLVKEPPLTSTPPQAQSFTTPPSRRALPSTHFKNMHSVFKVNPTLPPNNDLPFTKAESPSMYQPRFTSASTQTPPEFAPTDEETHTVYPDCSAGSSGQIFQSPSQSGGSRTSHYPQRSVRGRTRGKALSYGSSGPPQPHLRDAATLYTARDGGYQQNYRRAGGRHNTSTGWSDSSQVSSPDRDNNFTILDSGQGESLSVSTVDIPLTPHPQPHPHPEPPHTAPVLPLPLYPLSQPLRIAFTASRTANFAPGNLDQPIVFDQLHSNIGDMYDTHIGRFTCPINGTYVFMFHILKLAINVPLYINLMRNEEVMVSAYANDGAPDHETASNHAILPLFQGDQVWLRLHRGAIYGSTWKYSTFSGFILYQD